MPSEVKLVSTEVARGWADTNKTIQLHVALISPARRMPTDIWEIIFVACLSAEQTYDVPNPKIAPLLLCHICQGWRRVASATPALWTSLSLIVSSGSIHPALDLAKVWLDRSGALPLSLAFRQQNETPSTHIATRDALEMLIVHASRWKHLRLNLCGPTSASLLRILVQEAPLLETFDMCLFYPPRQQTLGSFQIFKSAPMLTSVSISQVPNYSTPVSMNIFQGSMTAPWSQLVNLSLDCVSSVGLALLILDSCPELVTCSFGIELEDGLPDLLLLNFRDPLIHEGLKSLDLNMPHDELASLFDRLTVPALEEVAVRTKSTIARPLLQQQGLWPRDNFTEFMTRSVCKISTLRLSDTAMTSNQLVDLLKHSAISQLKTLVIEHVLGENWWTWDPVVTPEVLSWLTLRIRPRGGAKFWSPHLETIELKGGCIWSPDGQIADMIGSRWVAGGLKNAKIDLLPGPGHEEDQRRLKEFKVEGLKLDLVHGI